MNQNNSKSPPPLESIEDKRMDEETEYEEEEKRSRRETMRFTRHTLRSAQDAGESFEFGIYQKRLCRP